VIPGFAVHPPHPGLGTSVAWPIAFALKCKEIKHDKPAVALKPAAPPATGPYPRDWRTLVWDWQPADLGLPRLQGHDLVELIVGPGLRVGAFGRRLEAPAIGQGPDPC